MGALIILTAALAAQATPASGSTPPAAGAEKTSSGPKVGQSTYVDLEAGAGYSTNPQFRLHGGGGQGFGRIAAHAVHTRITARTTTQLSAYAENVTYTGDIGSQQSLSFNGHHDAAVSEQLRLFGDLNASYQKGGLLDTRVLVMPTIPVFIGPAGTPPILVPGTPDFLSVTGRDYQVAANVGAQWALGPRDSLHLSTGVQRTVFRGGNVRSGFTTIPVTIGYDRQLSERATIGAQVAAEDIEYDGPTSVHLITPELTGSLSLSPTVSFSGGLGVSFSTVDDGVRTRHSTGPSANARLCSSSERGQLCGYVSIAQEAATTAGPAKTLAGGIDYTRQLSASSSIALSAGVDHYSSPTSVITGRNFSSATYYRAAAEYSRRIGNRLFTGANLSGRKVAESGPDPKADISASLFIRYRLGDIQ
jgi:hypothetical protein